MNHCRRIISGIFPDDRVAYHRFSQKSFHISLAHSFIDSIFQKASFHMDVLPQFHKYHGHTGILTDWNHVFPGNFQIFLELMQYFPAQRRLFPFCRLVQRIIHIAGKIIIGFYAHFFDIVCNFFG